MTPEEKEWSDDKLSSEITKLKNEIESEIQNRGKNIKYTSGPNPTKRSQLLAKYASLKILNFILIEVSKGGGLEIDKALGSIASYAASLTGVNPTFFKVQGNSKGEAKITRFPAESSAELTKGKEINIIDKVNTKNGYYILGIANRLEQVIANLLDNSISFSQNNKKIEISLEETSNNLLMTIKDEGPGFSETSTQKIFKRFYSNRPTSFGKHSGLGLNIVKNIVELHKGTISASNRINTKGAQVEVLLPKYS